MHPIRAFVGHSFNESDEVVVRAFLDILESVVARVMALPDPGCLTTVETASPVKITTTQKLIVLC